MPRKNCNDLSGMIIGQTSRELKKGRGRRGRDHLFINDKAKIPVCGKEGDVIIVSKKKIPHLQEGERQFICRRCQQAYHTLKREFSLKISRYEEVIEELKNPPAMFGSLSFTPRASIAELTRYVEELKEKLAGMVL